MTQLSQCDACSQNVLKCFGYCIKQIDSILSKHGKNISHARTSLFSPGFDVICTL